MTFEWHNDYTTGSSVIDEQHKNLINLAEHIVNVSSNEALIKDLMLLYRHVREHFQLEEQIMAEYHYPERAHHVAEHDLMLGALVDKSATVRAGQWEREQVLEFMQQWLSHIKSCDSQFKDFLTQGKTNTL